MPGRVIGYLGALVMSAPKYYWERLERGSSLANFFKAWPPKSSLGELWALVAKLTFANNFLVVALLSVSKASFLEMYLNFWKRILAF